MTDRSLLSALETMDDAKAEEIMTSALKGLKLLRKSESKPALKILAEKDPSLKVRQEAIEALKEIK
jgi:HEAT repeat protein